MLTFYVKLLEEFGEIQVCHPERSEGSREHKEVDVHEILPPSGRLNDNK